VNFIVGSATVSLDTLVGYPLPPGTQQEQITYEGIPVFNWLTSRAAIFVAANPIVTGRHTLSFRFRGPVELGVPGGSTFARALRTSFEISGGWFAHKIEIDATSGVYDWLRQTIRLGPGPKQVIYKGIKFGEGGTPVDCPPELDLVMPRALRSGEFALWVVDLGHIKMPDSVPDLDRFVVPADLEPLRIDIHVEAYCSA
jgi:hypothetical protein